MTKTDVPHSHTQDHRAYLATLTTPYQLGKDGKIRTIRRLDRKPPLALVPRSILELRQEYERGTTLSTDARKLADVRKRLRRYHLLDPPTPKGRQTKADRSAYYKAWRQRNPGYGRVRG